MRSSSGDTPMRTFLLIALAAVALALQSPAPIPPFEGDGNPDHDRQPKWCQSHDDTNHVHNCDCRASHCDPGEEAPNAGESPRCKVYCRKTACRCKNPCGT